MDPRGAGGASPRPIEIQFLEKRVNFWEKRGKKWLGPPFRKIFQTNLKAPPLPMTEFWILH